MEATDRRHPASLLMLAFRPLRDMFVFSGRSIRSEVFAFLVLGGIANMMTFTVSGGLAEPLFATAKLLWNMLWSFPWFALLVRRLHDQGRSGRWALLIFATASICGFVLMLVPQDATSSLWVSFLIWTWHPAWSPAVALLFVVEMAAMITALVLYLLPGEVGANRFGPDPRLIDDQYGQEL